MGTALNGESVPTWVLGLGGSVLGILIAGWVGIGPLGHVLVVLMVTDIVSGTLAAFVSGGGLSSDKSRRGMAKRAMELLLVMVVSYAGSHLGAEYGISLPAGGAVAAFFAATELVSILENAVRADINIGPLKAVLEITRKSVNATDNNGKPPVA